MSFTLGRDTVTPDLQRMMRQARNPRPILEAGAKVLQVEIVKHLRAMEARGNARGWPSQKFFAGGPNSVDKRVGLSSITDRDAVISISDPRFFHHVTGGTVRPKRAKALAIPLTAEAARLGGRGTLREAAPGLQFIKTKQGAFLARVLGASITYLFILLKSVTHRPHPEVLPDLNAIGPRVRAGMVRAAQMLLRNRT